MLNVTIDGIKVQVKEGSTILQAAQSVGIEIPTLCYLKDLTPEASCRICLVEIEGNPKLFTACSTPVAEGNVIHTKSGKVIAARRSVLDLMLSTHRADCFSCAKNGECQLQNLCYEYGVEKTSYEGVRNDYPIDDSNEFFTYDPQQCILCQRCVNVCQKLHGESAIGIVNRGFKAKIATPFDRLLRSTNCVSCGNCVSVCPVGALLPKSRVRFRAFETKKVPTTCTYCGVGCQLELQVKDNTVVGAQPLYGEANKGLLCVKGKFGYNFINHKDRLTKPLIRKDGVLVESEWDEAIGYIADKIKAIKAESGADALAGLSSARCSNEDNYVFQKMMRAAIGTNNVDHCARLCYASTVAGLAITLGSGAMTNSIAEAADQDVVFVTGSNTTETHPVIGSLIRQAKRKGAKIIVAEPRRIPLCREADVFLQIKPGTNVALFNGMMNVIISEGLQDQKYIDERTEGYEALCGVVKDYTPEVVAEICNIDAEELKKAARLYAKADKAGIYYAMGVTQHSTGTEGVMGTSNLALLCGKIGKYGCGVNPLRGQNNVQGACDMGCLPTDFPAYQKVFNDAAREKFERAWGVRLSGKPGLTVTEIMNAVEEGKVRGLYIMGENPMMSDPNINHVRKALESCELLVVQDIFLTETAALADVVLPGCTFAEKDGTAELVDKLDILRYIGSEFIQLRDLMVHEKALALTIRGIGSRTLYCSPGELRELAAGHLLTEGYIRTREDIVSLELDEEAGKADIVLAAPGRKLPPEPLTDSCVFDPEILLANQQRFYDGSTVQKATAGTHRCALCDDSGTIFSSIDISRHNCIDKIAGKALLRGVSLGDKYLLTSGRIPMDMIRKAAALGVPMIVSRSTPTIAAVETARAANITLLGFSRENRFNIYSAPQRLRGCTLPIPER